MSSKRHSVDIGSMQQKAVPPSATDVRKTSVKSDIVGGGHDSDEDYGFDSQWSK